MKITDFEVIDLRVPTSDQLLGSDPFHKEPDYSSAVLHLKTDSEHQGVSVVFTVGAGTDWICYGIRDLCQLVVGTSVEDFSASPILLYRRLIDHHQLRWLHDGVFRMAAGAILNAMWDLWAKQQEKPLWKLLVDLEPAFVADCIDWRNIEDALTRDEALDILEQRRSGVSGRENQMSEVGPKAYCTAGWLGLSDKEILASIHQLQEQGFDSFKLKVGRDNQQDVARIKFMRDAIGMTCNLMVDANQYWGVDEAKEHLEAYRPFGLKWVEEPIARDDVLGYIELASAFSTASFDFACGEQAASPVIFKQLIKSGAIKYCQIDAVRVAGVKRCDGHHPDGGQVQCASVSSWRRHRPVQHDPALRNVGSNRSVWTLRHATGRVHRLSSGLRLASRSDNRWSLCDTKSTWMGSRFCPRIH